MRIWVLKFKCWVTGYPLREEIRLYPTEKGARRVMKDFQKRDRDWPTWNYKDFELYELDGSLVRIA